MRREALGYVVDYSALAGCINAAMETAGVEIRRGAAVTDVLPGSTFSTVRYEQSGESRAMQSSLAALADGGRSLQGIAHLQRKTREYGQCALVARVTTELPHEGVAYERFTPKGPVALLPWGESRQFALVWTASPERAEALLALDEKDFLRQLHNHFGDRVGRFEAVSGRNLFPLKMAWVRPLALDRVVFIGNAAQTLHPVAGQGFNLGLRDAWDLAQLIANAPQQAGSPAMLAAYSASRRLDTGGGMLFTDLLVRAFSNDLPGWGKLRGASLGALELLPPARNFLMRKMSFGARW
jgi:2-octaprenyl-6-methoxyphenol hydroxylase